MTHTRTHTLGSLKRAFCAIVFVLVGFLSLPLSLDAASIKIDWDDNSPGTPPNDTPETAFEVWRSQGAGNLSFSLLATTAANITTYTDTNLPYNTTFNYKVRAINTTLVPPKESAFSNVVTSNVPAFVDTIAPTAPTSLASSQITQTSLSLAWTAATDNVGVTGYRISRNGTVLKTVTTTSTTDAGLAAATTYAYSIVAIDAAGNMSPAANISVTTLAPTAPAAPSNVKAVVID